MNINNYKSHIYRHILDRGMDYYYDNRILKIRYNERNNTFYSKIDGNYDNYDTSLTIINDEIVDYFCTCPAGGFCKHLVVSVEGIKNNEFLRKYANKDKYLTNIKTIDNLLSKNVRFLNKTQYKDFFKQIYPAYLLVKENNLSIEIIEDLLNIEECNYNNKIEFILEFHEFINKITDINDKKRLVKSTYFKINDEKRYDLIEFSQVSIKSFEKNQQDFFAEASILYLPELFFLLDKSTGVAKVNKIINTILKNKEYQCFFHESYKVYEKKFNENVEIKRIKKIIKNGILEASLEGYLKMREEFGEELSFYLISKLNFNALNITEMFKLKKHINFTINYANIGNNFLLENIEILKEVDYLKAKNHIIDIFKDIDDDDENISSDLIELIKAFNIHNEFKLPLIIKIILIMLGDIKLDNSLVIKEGGLPSRYYYLDRIKEDTNKKNEKIVLIYDESEFKETAYMIEKDEEEEYTLRLRINLFKDSFEKQIGEYYGGSWLDDDDYYDEDDFDFEDNHIDSYKLSPTKDTDERDLVIKNLLNKKREQLTYEKSIKESTKMIKSLKDKLLSNTKIDLSVKAKLTPMIQMRLRNLSENIYSSQGAFLYSSKIGVKTDYIIKDIVKFFTQIENEEIITYGKGLSFAHRIDQFDDISVEKLEIFRSYKGESNFASNRGIFLPKNNERKLIDLSDGIFFSDYNKIFNKLTLFEKKNSYEVKIMVDSENIKENVTEILDDNIKLVLYERYDLLFNLSNNTFSLLEYKNKKQRDLFYFLITNPKFAYNVVKEDFLKEILPFLTDEIILSEDVKLEANTYILNIESYLDYNKDKDIIILKTKYLQDGIEVTDLKNNSFKHKIEMYEKVISDFGFKDNLIKDQDDIIRFLNADLSTIKKLATIYISEDLKSLRIKKISKVNVNISLSNGMLKTHIDNSDLDNKALAKVLNAYKKGKKYVLFNDEVILTNTAEVIALNDFLTYNNLNEKQIEKDILSPIYNIFKVDYKTDLNYDIEEKLNDLVNKLNTYENILIEDKPIMYDDLKPYQVTGFKWLKNLYDNNLSGILADDMGLGKTLQVITLFEHITTNKPLLVVCPKSLVYNWKMETKKFKASFDSIIYMGNKAERLNLIEEIKNINKKTLVITSYDTLRNDIELFSELSFDTAVLDEAQHIKTVVALKTKAVKDISALHKFVLTGTPIENSVSDLWSIFDFLMPNYLYSYDKFKKFEQKANEKDAKTLEFIVNKTKPFILRRRKSEVLKELPEKIERIHYTTFEEEEQKIYDAYLLSVKEKLEDPLTSKIDILADLTKLRQLCISPSLLYENYNETSSKIEAVKDIIESAILNGEKVLVFSSFVKGLDLLRSEFDKNDYYILTGQTSASDRITMVNEFNLETSNKKVFFISLKAGGTGLNLTGASVVVHLDPWWNIAAENQATDRAHRIGQTNNVSVYKVVITNTIEEKVLELQELKKELFDAIIEGNNNYKMEIDDYRFLLK